MNNIQLIIFIELINLLLLYLYYRLKLQVYLLYIKFTTKKFEPKQLSKELEEQMKQINDKYDDL
jgi:hypothetical protein